MGLFDGYFDPEQFQDSGGLLGRLQSLQQQQWQYQPGSGFSWPTPTNPGLPPSAAPSQDDSPARTLAIGNYQMPQFGNAVVPQMPSQPGFGDRLSAGFQNWAQTPVGNPFAALANGMTGFGSGQRSDASGTTPPSTQAPTQPLDIGDRLAAGLQNWARTPVGSPFAALANGISGLSSGQRNDAVNAPTSDVHAQYQALRPVLGDKNAMMAVIYPQARQAMLARALAGEGDSPNPATPAPAAIGNGAVRHRPNQR